MINSIEVKNLTYKKIFENFDISIEKNKFITISGPNNCGKTTLIKILSGIINANAEIYLNGIMKSEYKTDEYIRKIRLIIPEEEIFQERNLEETLELYSFTKDHNRKEIILDIITSLKLKKLLKKDYRTYSPKEKVISQLVIALVKNPEVLLIDNLDKYFTNQELINIFTHLSKYRQEYGLTLVCTTTDLNLSLYTDYLYIINDKKISLEGVPLKVLEKDNIINKIGLSLPFMVDLSVKLRDYDLLSEIELDKERMVDKLWN